MSAPQMRRTPSGNTKQAFRLSRRAAIASAAAVGVDALARPATAESTARSFVLVHGAWHGGWCWRRVADRLERAGNKVYAPSLTGLADRRHLLSAKVNVSTHIEDVANLIHFEELRDVVLVGHSYAGLVISGVAEKARDAIRSIVFLDAFVPQSGQSLFSLSSQRLRDTVQAAAKRGELGMPPASAAYFNVNPSDRAFVDRKCTPQPIGTYSEAVVLTGARERIAKKTYIRTTGFKAPGFDSIAARLRSDPTWNVREMPCGHDAMLDMPDRLTELLLEAA